jgi:fructose-1,6-bisphosphatase I
LIHSGVVSTIVSEETNEIITVDHSHNNNGVRRFSVAYDPLDGSSLVDVNLAVGTIVAIYDGDNIMQAGRHQVAAMYILYGPRTTLVFSTGNGVHEFAMNQLMEYTLVHENIQLAECGAIYSPGGQRNKYTAGTEKFVRHLEEKGAKLRYSGGFVPDINQIMIKGKGIFLYPHLQGAPQGKLRLLYELYPMAYLVEQAGGAASTGKQRILDIIPAQIDERAPVFIGCKDDVALAESFIAEHG